MQVNTPVSVNINKDTDFNTCGYRMISVFEFKHQSFHKDGATGSSASDDEDVEWCSMK